MAKVAKVYDGSAWQDIATNQPDNSNYPTYTSIQFGFRNELINGDFRINQRAYASGSVLSTSDSATPLGYGYSFDRWKATTSGTFLNFVSAPNGQQITISANGSIAQIIERQNIAAGTHTLSWIGTATARVYNVGATAPAYAASPVTVSLDGTANVIVEFTAVTSPRTLNLVQLEQGGRQTSFEYRPIGIELALCQRYYYRVSSRSGGTAALLTSYQPVVSTTSANVIIQTPVTMRTMPSAIDFANIRLDDTQTNPAISSLTFRSGWSSDNNVAIVAASTGLTTLRSYAVIDGGSGNGYIGISAEL